MSERVGLNAPSVTEPVEFSVEDAILNTWVEDTSFYLRLDLAERESVDAHTPDVT